MVLVAGGEEEGEGGEEEGEEEEEGGEEEEEGRCKASLSTNTTMYCTP